MDPKSQLIIRQREATLPFVETWTAMKTFTDARSDTTPDEIWVLEHTPVFTQGLAGKSEHVLNPKEIPVVQTDRGGQITYHGPGQLVIYLLLDLQRLGLNSGTLVHRIEAVLIDYLASLGITASAKAEAPGIYIKDEKVCSIGLRIRKGRSYHGLAFNVSMDLEPFSRINPCGFKGLRMTQLSAHAKTKSVEQVRHEILPFFLNHFGYNLSLLEETTGLLL